MAELLRIANAQSRPRRQGDFVETETARDIYRSLDLVRTLPGPALTIISGAPGVGKTRCLRQFCASEGFDAIFLSIASGEGKPFAAAENLLRLYNVRAIGKSLAECRNILVDYIGLGRVLILDDAHFLDQDAAEWVRALAEEGGFDLVLSGGLGLAALVNRVPQLQSRMLRPVIVKSVSRADVAELVAGSSFDHSRGIDTLHAVATLKGGLRNVEKALQLSDLFAGTGVADMGHLEAAIADLKLAPKGGK